MKFTTLVLSGGSVKGISILGALFFIERTIGIDKIKNYFATSSGTIISLLLAIGCTPVEILTFFSRVTFQIDLKLSRDEFHCIKFDTIINVLREIVTEKLKTPTDPTFSSVNCQFKKNLVFISYNYSRIQMEIFSLKTSPNMSCIEAVKLSCALPFIFEKCIYNNDLYIDGGIVSNFPLDLAIEHKATNILGLYLNFKSDRSAHDSVLMQMMNLIFAPINNKTDNVIRKYKNRATIIELSSNLSFTTFKLEVSEVMNMFAEGFVACRNKFEDLEPRFCE